MATEWEHVFLNKATTSNKLWVTLQPLVATLGLSRRLRDQADLCEGHAASSDLPWWNRVLPWAMVAMEAMG